MEGIQTFKGSWPWPWPWPLPIYQISLKSKKLFVDGRTDGHSPPPILLGRLTEVDLKMPKRYLYAVRGKWNPVNNDQLQISRNWTRYCRRWLGDWMYEKEKNTSIFVFRPKMNVLFRFPFVFGRKGNFIFVGILDYGRKWKMLFGRHLLYIIKRSWFWDGKCWSSTLWDGKSWSSTLGLVLVFKDF